MNHRIAPLLLISALPVAALADDPPSPPAVPEVVKGITAREIGGHMKFLASDLMRGRDTASPEIRLAAEYLATRLSAAGAQPLGDPSGGNTRSYFQAFPLEYVTPQLEGTSVTLMFEEDGSKRVVPCQMGVDVDVTMRGLTPGETEAEVVFAGHGQYNPDQGIDDFKGLNVKGRFVLVFSGGRPNAGGDGPRRGGRGGMNGSPRALELGALGVISVRPTPNDQVAAGNRPTSFGRPMMTLGHAPAQIPTFTFAEPMRELILKACDLTPESKPTTLEHFRVRFEYAAKKELKQDRNVVGFFPGSDPEKAKEVVIYSAHYDHVGVDEKGEIFNGSDDNASGTSALLEIAEAFGDGPRPARSVAFLWVSGEEKGLLGSQWFSDHMTLPEGHKVVADLNLDMVSRNAPNEIGITPSDKHQDYSTLIPAALAACKEEGLTAKYDADQYYFRTDSYNFAKKGIPVIFFFCGVHEDYHKSTDDFTKADFDKAAKVARSAYRLGWQVASDKDVPKKIKAEGAKTADAR